MSPDSTVFAHPGNRTISKPNKSGTSIKIVIYEFQSQSLLFTKKHAKPGNLYYF